MSDVVAPETETETFPEADDSARAESGPALSDRLEEARRLYDLASIVHEHRVPSAVDSAPLAHRSLVLAFRVLVELRDGALERSEAEVLERGSAIAVAESLSEGDVEADCRLIVEMKDRFADSAATTTSADGRRYDRAFARYGNLLGAIRADAAQRVGARQGGLRRHLKAVAFIGATCAALGFLVGMRMRPVRSAAPQEAAVAPRAETPATPAVGFKATYFRDQELGSPVFTRVDPAVDFNWQGDKPQGLEQPEHFSARWEGTLHVEKAGKHEFFLTSDDGSRLLIDDKMVIDSWTPHGEVTLGETIELSQGTHKIRVDFFDSIGNAVVKLEWQPEGGQRRVVAGQDLR